MATKVIFRKWRSGGETIALFPEIAADNHGFYCQSYEHIGQHGGADTDIVVSRTVPATPAEYADLLEELRRIGYDDLAIVKRCTRQMQESRHIEAEASLRLDIGHENVVE